MKKGISGFTIVELLIVIVVIAILAAITIVGYNTISKRANDTAVMTDMSTLAKKLSIAKIDGNDLYPAPNTPALNTLKFQASTHSYDTTKWCFTYWVSPDKQEYFAVGISKSGATYYTSHESLSPKRFEGTYSYKGTAYTSTSSLVSANSLGGLSGYSPSDKQWRQWTIGGA